MKYLGLVKKALWGLLAAGIVLGSSVQVYCTEDWYNDTNVQEHISKVEEQLKAAGYTLNRTMGDSNSSQPVAESVPKPTSTDSTAPKQDSTKTVESCDHSYVDSIIKEPTCAETGIMESRCSKCGDVYKTEIPETGKHEYSSEVTKEATCTEKGVITYTCTVCGDSYTEDIPMIDHTYESSIAVDATCTTAGTKVFICSQCDDTYTEEIPATGHVEEEVITKEAGAFTTGEKIIKCSSCGEILSTEIIPSKYPLTYLIIGIACVVAVLVGVILILKKRR